MFGRYGYKRGNRLIDLKGRIFGHLLVKKIDITQSSRLSNKHMANAYWRCRCDLCDCIVSVRSDHLRKGETRMCGPCASEARIRFFLKMQEMERMANGKTEEEVEKPKRKKLKFNRCKSGTNKIVFVIQKSYSQEGAVKQVVPLRKSGMSIKDIMDLLTMTRDDVMKELSRHRSES